jgi:hypothetical protein
MGRASGAIWRGGRAATLALVAVSVAAASTARADVTTERSSSILVFPKVMSTPATASKLATDTIIQISNTSNSMVFAHCFYVNGAPLDPTQLPSSTNQPQCQEIDFDIFLTKQQPTHWVVSTGRLFNPGDFRCAATTECCAVHGGPCPDNSGVSGSYAADCCDAGFDPGHVPPVSDFFTGELKCIEVDSSGAPINGNHLKGEATIVTTEGDASKYNAIGVMGLNTNSNVNNSDNTLCLGGGVTPSCPTGAEYNACPETLIVNHFAAGNKFTAGASDPVINEFASDSEVNTEVTIVPCTEDFENQVFGTAVVQFDIYNEFEDRYSTSTPLAYCWANLNLGTVSAVFTQALLGTRFAQTRMYSADPAQAGILGVVEEFHSVTGGNTTRDALNLHGEGDRPDGDFVVLPGAF